MYREIQVIKLLAPIVTMVVMLVIGIAASGTVQLEHNWGFELVSVLIGQAQDSPQWLGALFLQAIIVPSIAASIVFGYFKQHFKGTACWYVIPLLLVCWPYLGTLVEPSSALKKCSEMTDLLLAFLFLISLLFVPGTLVAEALFRELSQRTRAWRVLFPGLVSISLLSIYHFFGAGSWVCQLTADVVAIVFATAFAVFLNKCKTFDKAALCTLFTLLPILIFDLTNILFDMGLSDLFLFIASGNDTVEQESMRAHFSALLITCWHFCSALMGIMLGVWLTTWSDAVWQKRKTI